MFYAYVLRRLKDESYYYGSAENVPDRIKQRNCGKIKYTKGHLLCGFHYGEEFATRHEAITRERLFKSISGYRWL